MKNIIFNYNFENPDDMARAIDDYQNAGFADRTKMKQLAGRDAAKLTAERIINNLPFDETTQPQIDAVSYFHKYTNMNRADKQNFIAELEGTGKADPQTQTQPEPDAPGKTEDQAEAEQKAQPDAESQVSE